MMQKNARYTKTAKRLINTIPELSDIKDGSIAIAYLSSDEEKKQNGKLILGKCTKVSEQYKWCCDYDFFITLYEPNIASFDDKQIEILLEHELRHIGVNMEGTEPSYYVVPHDIEEFNSIIEKYGLHWDREE